MPPPVALGRLAAALLLALLPAVAAAQEEERITIPKVTYSFTSDPGDFLGQGAAGTRTSATGTWRLKNGPFRGVDLRYSQSSPTSDSWTFCLAPESDPLQFLAPGPYAGVKRCSPDADHPGLDVTQSPRGCSTVTGSFQVASVLYDYYGSPIRFAGSFEQHCEGAGPALHGTLDAAKGTVGPAPFAAQNLVLVTVNRLFEITRAGAVVDSVPLLVAAGTSPTATHAANEIARDAALGADGRLYVFNGTGTGTGPADVVALSVFDTLAGTWEHHTVPGWSVWGSTDSAARPYGGIGLLGDHVFVTDMLRNGDDNGLIRFDTANAFAVDRFAAGNSYIDLSAGLDGKVYALRVDQKTVDVFDPDTLAAVGGPLVLDNDGDTGTPFPPIVSIAVDAGGQLFAAEIFGDIHRFSAAGVWQQELDIPLSVSVTDLDLEPDRTLILARENRIHITDTAFSGQTQVLLPDPTAGTNIDRPGFLAVHIASLAASPLFFADGFESSDTSRWSPLGG
jgi:hypothetical protein